MVTSTHHVCQNGGGGSSGALPAAHPIWLTANADLGGMGCQDVVFPPRGQYLHEEGSGVLPAPEQGGPGGCPGADMHIEACPRLSMSGEHDVSVVVQKWGILRAGLGLRFGEDEELWGGTLPCAGPVPASRGSCGWMTQ